MLRTFRFERTKVDITMMERKRTHTYPKTIPTKRVGRDKNKLREDPAYKVHFTSINFLLILVMALFTHPTCDRYIIIKSYQKTSNRKNRVTIIDNMLERNQNALYIVYKDRLMKKGGKARRSSLIWILLQSPYHQFR